MVKKFFLYLLSALMFFGGVNHFLNTGFYLSMMPPYLPFHLELVFLSGVAEIICGVLLLIPKTRVLGAWFTILTLIAIFPANVYMAQNPELFLFASKLGLYIRLPFQFVLIGWASFFVKKSN